MGDLEDRFLKENIPGKYSWWNKDDDEVGPRARKEWVDEEASDPEEEMTQSDWQKKWIKEDCPETVRRCIAASRAKAERRGEAQTGVKAVLADYKAFQESARADRELEKQYREALLLQMAGGGRGAYAAAEQGQDGEEEEAGDSDGGYSDDDDEAFLESYRQKRLQELKAQGKQSSGTGSSRSSRGGAAPTLATASAVAPEFGQVREVERQEFLHEVDGVPKNVYVVVHIYEPYIHACQVMNRSLELIAQKFTQVKILRMRSIHMGDDYDHVALPTLMIYCNKELVACSTRITDDLGETFTKADVESLLAENGVIEIC